MARSLEELEAAVRRGIAIERDGYATVDVAESDPLAILRDLLEYLRTQGDSTELALRARLDMARDREAELRRELEHVNRAWTSEASRAGRLERELRELREARPFNGVRLCDGCHKPRANLSCFDCARTTFGGTTELVP